MADATAKKPPTHTPRCGTPSGYTAHQNRDEKPCNACARAKSEYDARHRSAPARAKASRLAARAQGKAETRLRHMYPDDYARLYAEEKAKLLAEEASS